MSGALSYTARTHSDSVTSAWHAHSSSAANSFSFTFVPMDFIRGGTFIAHRRFDWVEVSGGTLAVCRNVPRNGPNPAVFSLRGGESSSYPFSNARLLSKQQVFSGFSSYPPAFNRFPSR
jgi:hypothetical protein